VPCWLYELYELYALAARDPALRAITQQWTDHTRTSLQRHVDVRTAPRRDSGAATSSQTIVYETHG
jgi:DNA-binding transcriptional regulator YbjK